MFAVNRKRVASRLVVRVEDRYRPRYARSACLHLSDNALFIVQRLHAHTQRNITLHACHWSETLGYMTRNTYMKEQEHGYVVATIKLRIDSDNTVTSIAKSMHVDGDNTFVMNLSTAA